VNETEDNNRRDFDAEFDASDLFCPLPVLSAKKTLDKMSANSVLKLTATDPAAEKDIEVFVEQAGYTLIDTEHGEKSFTFYIEKTTS